MKKVKTILSGSILLIIVLIIFAVEIKDKIPRNIFCFLDIGTYQIPPKSVEINSANIYGQSFVSNFDSLFMISIFIPKQNLNRDGELYFHLKRKGDDKDLVTLSRKFNQIRFSENNFYIIPPDRESTEKGFHFHFQFSPIRDSKNKEFYLYFESPNTRPEEGIKIGVWDDKLYYEALTKGQMFVNKKPANGFLAFRTYNAWQGNISLLLNEMKVRLLKDKQFFTFYCIVLFLILLAAITFIIKTKNI